MYFVVLSTLYSVSEYCREQKSHQLVSNCTTIFQLKQIFSNSSNLLQLDSIFFFEFLMLYLINIFLNIFIIQH